MPGSTSATATEIFHEGLLLPPVKLWSAGQFNQDLERLILANSRQPELVRGDVRAQVAVTQMGAKRLAELAGRGQALEFSRAFSERWANDDPEALGYLYLDGHVRPYHGRKHNLPKTHVQQRRLCMPATTDYWVNDANAEPQLLVTAPATDGRLSRMDTALLPAILLLAGEQPRATG